jgi:hypothetical protein
MWEVLGHEIPTGNNEDCMVPTESAEGCTAVQNRKPKKERNHDRYVAPVAVNLTKKKECGVAGKVENTGTSKFGRAGLKAHPHKYDDKTNSVATHNVTSDKVTGDIDEGHETIE